MPVLDAGALERDPEGTALLGAVLRDARRAPRPPERDAEGRPRARTPRETPPRGADRPRS